MRELCIRLGGHLTSGGLKLGDHTVSGGLDLEDHTTSGIIDLFNFLSRLYSGLEAAVVVDASSGKCLLRKPCVAESSVTPAVPDIRPLLYVRAGAENACLPGSCAVEAAALRAFGRLNAGAVPEADLVGQLSCPVSGSCGTLVSVEPVCPVVMRVLGEVFSGTVVQTEDVGAALAKYAGAASGLCPASDAQAALEKSGRGEAGVEVSASASVRVGRYRKLYEADPMTLGEMDDMTLDELDFIYTI